MHSSRSLTTSFLEFQPVETYIILGDFNASVRSREGDDNKWSGVRGPHAFGLVNDAGLLSYLSLH